MTLQEVRAQALAIRRTQRDELADLLEGQRHPEGSKALKWLEARAQELAVAELRVSEALLSYNRSVNNEILYKGAIKDPLLETGITSKSNGVNEND